MPGVLQGYLMRLVWKWRQGTGQCIVLHLNTIRVQDGSQDAQRKFDNLPNMLNGNKQFCRVFFSVSTVLICNQQRYSPMSLHKYR